MSKPRAILGTMTIGGQTSEADASTMLSDFCGSKWSELARDDPMVDTAIMYVNGQTEKILGSIFQKAPFPDGLSIATKANPFTKDKDLSPTGVRAQLQSSLAALGKDKVDIFYLHAPDVNHDIEPTLEEVQRMHLEGKFCTFGLSNFSAWETVYIHSYMSRRGYVVPAVYQGMYNAITRRVESELLPALRKVGIRFYAYNPLGGGMLSGKYRPAADEGNDAAAAEANAKVGGRFAGNSFWAKRYRERFQQRQQFEALEVVRESLGEGESMADASLRWLMHHSQLREGDGIIVGASKLEQYHSNMESLSSGPLSERVVEGFDKAYRLCEDVCPDYARGYSGSSCQ